MESHSTDSIRENGIYYTPTLLAKTLVHPIISRADLSIFDPACGEGALLFAARDVCDGIAGSKNQRPEFYGSDKIAPRKSLGSLRNFHFYETDFFDFSLPDKKFDLVLMNPPFVRHHLLTNDAIDKYQQRTNSICRVKKTSDLWAYFLIGSTKFLEKGGAIGAILPRSFLQSDYSLEVRDWLINKFGEIRILALTDEYFDETNERVLLVWLKDYGTKAKSIKIGISKHLNEYTQYFKIDKSKWLSPIVVPAKGGDIEGLLSRCIKDFGFSRFRNFADIKIGVVTGADKFFIVDSRTAKTIGFNRHNSVPIICSSKELTGLSLDGYDSGKRLLVFPKKPSNGLNRYLKEGRKSGYHLRAHSLRRIPWFCVETGAIPDGFFPYRSYDTPCLVFNRQETQCTNSIHRIYFKKMSENAKKWIQISLLSSVGQLSLEAYSKTYGRGIMKIEPSSLKNALVLEDKKRIPNKYYNEISHKIQKRHKWNAVLLASKFIDEALKIPKSLSKEMVSALEELKNFRLSRTR